MASTLTANQIKLRLGQAKKREAKLAKELKAASAAVIKYTKAHAKAVADSKKAKAKKPMAKARKTSNKK